ncbi:MAG: flagellar hook-length control protein FliK, partial [Sphingomonadaceae bacterium]|nr:flagellar hook-length control protein FliK [Sphingomonadaceae bacterium]
TAQLLAARAPTPAPTVDLAPTAPSQPVTGATLAAIVAGKPAVVEPLKTRHAEDSAPDSLVLTPATASAPVSAAAVPEVARAPLDTRQHDWPRQMIDRIEQLRDAANANDASIRLAPPSLGKLDVTLRQDAGGTTVHFHAAEPATRQLLADAQPQLTALAEQRGLRLAGTSVDTGGAGPDRQGRQAPTPAPQLPVQPPRAAEDAPTAAPTGRLA